MDYAPGRQTRQATLYASIAGETRTNGGPARRVSRRSWCSSRASAGCRVAEWAGGRRGRDHLPALGEESGDVLAARGALDRQANSNVGSREIGAEGQSQGNKRRTTPRRSGWPGKSAQVLANERVSAEMLRDLTRAMTSGGRLLRAVGSDRRQSIRSCLLRIGRGRATMTRR
jgi:hypothetical protein